MQRQVHYLAPHNQTQAIFSKILTKVMILYQRFVSNEVRILSHLTMVRKEGLILLSHKMENENLLS